MMEFRVPEEPTVFQVGSLRVDVPRDRLLREHQMASYLVDSLRNMIDAEFMPIGSAEELLARVADEMNWHATGTDIDVSGNLCHWDSDKPA